jgi:hypothetical protein
VFDSTTTAALAAAFLFAVLLSLVWRSLVRSRRLVAGLQRQVASLERAREARPSLRVAFEFNAGTREALVHVSNDGGDGEVSAGMSIEGALAQPVENTLQAAWIDEVRGRVMIRRGRTRTLRLAQLDLSVFPYAQWQVYAVGEVAGRTRSAFSVRAMHTSMIGGDPDTHAPPIFLQVVFVSSPEPYGPPAGCTIALQPFEAVRLRPV